MKPPFRVPDATYRVQLHAGFTFEQLAAIVPYLQDLGISDVYASPLFRAAPGSMHGYDVCDQNEVSPELGGIEGLEKLSALLRQRGMGLLLDFVPNHMGIEGPYNWRWIDVLEHGTHSRYASFFDIQWNPRHALLHERILLPVLHDFYGRVLEDGGIQVAYDDGAFWVGYGALRLPLCPASYGTILDRLAWFKNPGTPVAQRLEQMAVTFRVPPEDEDEDIPEVARERNRGREKLRREFADLLTKENLREDVQTVLKALNGTPGRPASFNNLHDILEEQHYRLAFWKSGSHEINYRRFFAVDSLVGVHMERQEVFDETHRLLRDLVGRGIATGIRIDHIDGLWDPARYLQRLARLDPQSREPVYILVEKILTERETLPADWAVHGASGYEFTCSLINLFIDSRQEEAFTRLYHDFAGMILDPHEQAYEIKLFIMEAMFPKAIDALTEDLEASVKSDRRWRDWTGGDLRVALSRIVACLSVYRTYRRAGKRMSESDRRVVERAVEAALKRNPSADPLAFHFVRDVWIGAYPDAMAEPGLRRWADEWVCKLQQYTGAIMAKSIEDTFFYRYVRLFGANEVGHHPAEFGLPVDSFHEENAKRLATYPACMLGTSTHDTKLSEDARARLLALSELPDRWGGLLRQWGVANRDFKTEIGGVVAPDANEEYLLYQILLASWPPDEAQVDDVFRDRIRAYMRKALSESKANTNWVAPNPAWEKAACDFADALLDRARAATFWSGFVPFAAELAWRGALISLAQTALKLTSPGVPDVYQGCELWDFSLVDPDNRRPVDYAPRAALLECLPAAAELVRNWRDGRIKQLVTQSILRYRREHAELFRTGAYVPLKLEGDDAESFVAFLREQGEEKVLVLAAIRLGAEAVVEEMGQGARVILPEGAAGGWHNLLTRRDVQGGGKLDAATVLGGLPVAVLSLS